MLVSGHVVMGEARNDTVGDTIPWRECWVCPRSIADGNVPPGCLTHQNNKRSVGLSETSTALQIL